MEADYFFLLIEDNLIDQLITSQLLKRKLGIEQVSIVNNGKEGIAWLQENRKKMHKALIILLDIRMPEMDGFQFLEAYENLPSDVKSDTQIYMLSSTLDSTDINLAASNMHVRQLLSKPLAVKEFEKLLLQD